MDATDDQAPATKADINAMLRIVMGTLQDLERRMATKEDLKGFATKKDLDRFATKMDLLGLEVRFEQLREDVLGSLKDLRSNERHIADHERRITRLEKANAA